MPKTTADDLISEAAKVGASASPPAEAVDGIKKILASNDNRPRLSRVKQETVVKWLRDEYGWKHGRDTLMRWVKTELGRASWERK